MDALMLLLRERFMSLNGGEDASEQAAWCEKLKLLKLVVRDPGK